MEQVHREQPGGAAAVGRLLGCVCGGHPLPGLTRQGLCLALGLGGGRVQHACRQAPTPAWIFCNPTENLDFQYHFMLYLFFLHLFFSHFYVLFLACIMFWLPGSLLADLCDVAQFLHASDWQRYWAHVTLSPWHMSITFTNSLCMLSAGCKCASFGWCARSQRHANAL